MTRIFFLILILILGLPFAQAVTQQTQSHASQMRIDVRTLASETFDLEPFISDGCSRFPDGTPSQPTLWRSCCVVHDIKYWMGGTEKQRHDADVELKTCVASKGYDLTALLMQTGVEFFGTPILPVSWRWGFGWKHNRGYQPLSQAEINYARSLLKKK